MARNVLALEKRIEDGEFDPAALDDALLLRFHSLICGDLVPQLAGWRRTNVTVGDHEPPDFFKVPALVREYGRDLQARLSAAGGAREILLEALAFAEGRLLSIHPFADFNGRVTRVWLRKILRRLDLPPVQLAPGEEPAETSGSDSINLACISRHAYCSRCVNMGRIACLSRSNDITCIAVISGDPHEFQRLY